MTHDREVAMYLRGARQYLQTSRDALTNGFCGEARQQAGRAHDEIAKAEGVVMGMPIGAPQQIMRVHDRQRRLIGRIQVVCEKGVR